MDIQQLISDLEQATLDFDNTKRVQKPIEEKLVEDEIPLVKKFAEKIYPFAKKKKIHGEEALLIYVFEKSNKTLISPEVYIKNNGDIVYEVLDEAGYRRWNKIDSIDEGYVTIPLSRFLHSCSFYDIIVFFKERIDVLYEDAEKLVENNQLRRAFVEHMRKLL